MEQIEMMTMKELHLREEAHNLQLIDKQELMTNFAFENRMVQGADKDGNYVVKEPSQIANYTKIRKKITGEIEKDEAKVNQLKELSDRAQRAREEALKDLKKGGN
ncbi:hypothetical protein LQZ24_05835 [Fructobacillus sp. M1-13]|uniref:Uncharacterized protein n=1 Tax=Fructobacillus papyriferae TaxID=2713171 RepID=A0ABS5QPA1_9LACO|nr:hypothetical protein [Fructobacillus papyriferae]MBS9334998.1 hypothetical protein [Fructobacillus papyriferae]MCD2159516.1 hypothetical protein [Fructobacillus papyriferae]